MGNDLAEIVGLYKLDGHKAVRCYDSREWGRSYGSLDRIVQQSLVGDVGDEHIRVSTVFLGVDHSFGPCSKPLLFETMVFGGPLNGEMDRYPTWEEAEAGHKAMLNRVEDSLYCEEQQKSVQS